VLLAPLLAALLVGLGRLLGWSGVDYAAQVYRVDSVRAHGMHLWDFQWYGGNWSVGYSFLFPLFAATVGLTIVAVAAAAAAALAFDRLAYWQFGRAGRVASIVFAVGTVVATAIGQLTFLGGEAFGLWAFAAAARRHWRLAALLGLLSALLSPLAGLFVMVGSAGWAASEWGHGPDWRAIGRIASIGASAALPLVALALLFPGSGTMPYPVIDYVWEVCVAAFLWLLAAKRPTLRAGATVYALTATLSVVVPSAVGGNVGRLEDVLALPLAVALILGRWPQANPPQANPPQANPPQANPPQANPPQANPPQATPLRLRLRTSQRWRPLLALAVVPLALSQWQPAWTAIVSDPSQPSTHAAYFAPLVAKLRRLTESGPIVRVEVVPTKFHWEAAYVAPVVELARGWERQLDVAENPIFYKAGALSARSYRAWLLDEGVEYVALPDAPLDSAGKAEAHLVASGLVPGLIPVWSSANWRLYAVLGATGIVSAPGRLVSAGADRAVLDLPAAGTTVVRLRFNPDWRVSAGSACVLADGPWTEVRVPRAERLVLSVSLLGATGCPTSSLAATDPRRRQS
jgi:hypothetical protein